jgi:hypothetical protein
MEQNHRYDYLSFGRTSKHWRKASPPPQQTSPSRRGPDPRPGLSAAGPERDPTSAGPPRWRRFGPPGATATGGPRAPRGTCCGSVTPQTAHAPPTEPRRRPPLEARVRVCAFGPNTGGGCLSLAAASLPEASRRNYFTVSSSRLPVASNQINGKFIPSRAWDGRKRGMGRWRTQVQRKSSTEKYHSWWVQLQSDGPSDSEKMVWPVV